MPINEKHTPNAIRRFTASLSCGLAMIALGGWAVEITQPPTRAQINACAKAIGKRAVTENNSPQPVCGGRLEDFFSQYPETAHEFEYAANQDSGSDDPMLALDGVAIICTIGGYYGYEAVSESWDSWRSQ